MSEAQVLERTRAPVALSPPKLRSLPTTLPLEGAVRIELEEGVPVFRASGAVRARLEALLLKQQMARLGAEEERELDRYEEVDDYLSFVNRLVRNTMQAEQGRRA